MWRWSVEHSATPASLQQPATTCGRTARCCAKRNAHGSTPSYVDRDSLTQSSVSFTGPYAMNVLLMRIGRIVIAVGQPSPSSSYATGELKAIEKIPEGYRPASYGSILFASNNGGAVGSWYISSDGSITIRGKADKGYYQTCTGCWLTA